MLDNVRDFLDDHKWIPITAIAVVSVMVYASVGRVTLNYVWHPDKQAAYETCLEGRMAEVALGEISRKSCPSFRFDRDDGIIGAAFWPVTVPVVFAIRHPIGILLVAGSGLLLVFGAIGGHRAVVAKRERQRLDLEAAEALIRREAPDLLVSSD